MSAGAGAHWSDAYLGREYAAGEYDCADFVVEALEREFGVRWAPPRPDRAFSATSAGAALARERAIAALALGYARPLAPGEAPRDGDGVLMRAAGRRRGAGRHIGLWARIGGAACVVHCMAGAGVVRHALADLAARGLEVTAVRRWRGEADLERAAPEGGP